MSHALKRVFDFVFSLVSLIVLLPLMLVVSVVVAVTMGWPVIFSQKRPGLHGKIFTLYKFRTMRNDRDSSGMFLPDERRLTASGRFLRASSLDELPELINVLLGHMSLVGPRPLLPEYLDQYTPEQARRHDVRPGLTGIAQINGRQSIKFSERLQYDVWYVDHWSLWLDFKTVLLTVPAVICRKGVVTGRELSDMYDLCRKCADSDSHKSR